jgi:ornithine decarboxylase
MYGVFNNITFDHAKVTLKPLMPRDATKLFKSSVWGPTCDSIDLILKETLLPELVVGDWLICEEMGAYTSAAASGFNGFSKSKVFYTLPK